MLLVNTQNSRDTEYALSSSNPEKQGAKGE
jgi:hypothetical protein